MASFQGIMATGKSIARFLNFSFTEDPPVPNTKAVLVRTEEFKTGIDSPALSIYLYRVEVNRTARAGWSAVGAHDGYGHLPLDLHFLMTAWGNNAEHEYSILGRTMQVLETTPILTGPLLDPSGNWSPQEAIKLVISEISTEAVMRTFDSLPVDFKLSVPYLARIVRIDGQIKRSEDPVAAMIARTKPNPKPDDEP